MFWFSGLTVAAVVWYFVALMNVSKGVTRSVFGRRK